MAHAANHGSRQGGLSCAWPPAVITAVLSLVLTACGSSVGTSGSDAEDEGPLEVGLIVPATGPISATGLAMQTGFELGVEKINAEGGVNGQPVTFEVQDDRSDPATTAQIARRYAQDGVSLLFGTITGDTAAAVVPVATSERIPFATAILGDPAECSDYAWGFGESVNQLLKPFVPDLLEQYGTRVAIAGSDYNFPHQYAARAREVVEAGGGTIVAEEYSPLGTTDFESMISRLQAAEPDVLLSMVVGADAITFTQQAAQFGLLTPELGYEGAPLDADYYGALTTLLDGRDHSVRWSDALDHPDSLEFVDAYRDKTGHEGPIPEVAANAYFAIQFIAAAANDAGTTEPDALNTAIGGFEYDSPLGEGTHFDGPANILQANMLTATIRPGGTYEITKDHGLVTDTEKVCE